MGSNPDETPILYVIRDDEDITPAEYDLLEGQMKKVYDAPLHGEYYMRDNFQVFQKLRALLTGGLAETYLTDYEKSGNGREAWQDLLVAFEGEDAKNTAITAARNDIRTSTWERNTKNWSFDQYCLKHIRAHNTLKRYGVPMDGATMVREWMRGIHNASLQSVKTTILTNAESKENLHKAIITFKDMATTLDLVVFEKSNDERKVGAAHLQRGGGRTGYRGGYQGRGKGHHRSPPYKRQPDHRPGSFTGRHKSPYRGRGGGGGRGYSSQSTPREDDGLLLDQSILDQMNPKQRNARHITKAEIK